MHRTLSKHIQVSVIIPYYNEGERIIPIIEAIKNLRFVQEIIVVDDGSDAESQKILHAQEGIHVIRLVRNRGKAFVLETGVRYASAEIVAFVDSDLREFTPEHLSLMLDIFLEGKYDMVIGEREKEFGLLRRIGLPTMLAGERIIRKSTLIDHEKVIFSTNGYLIEAAINKVFFHQYSVGKVLLQGVGQYWKMQKSNIAALFLVDLPFTIQLIRFLGLKEFIYQLRFVKRLPYVSTW